MLERIEATLERFRIHFDSWAKQSDLERGLEELLAGLPTYQADGALYVRSTEFGDDKDRVLVRSVAKGGLPTYEAADIAYLRDKLERGYDRAIYVLGADHHGLAPWFATIARLLGYDPDRIEVLFYQLVHLTSGGERAKMSKRKGDVVFLDDFIDEVGVDFARWFLVDRGHDQTIEIDVDLAAERSRKNPVYYVQYVHARTSGIFREAPGGAEVDPKPRMPLAAEERELVKRLAEFPGVAREATDRRGPHAIPVYAIRLADDFHRFYDKHRVLAAKGSEHESFRLALVAATRDIVARCLDLVGVEAPEHM
jgi:arginyl-tRNA synthetase